MEHQNLINQTKGFTLIEVMVVVMILSLLAAIAIPNYIRIRNKGYCSQAENDANIVARAISAYFAIPSHTALPETKDLSVVPLNPVEISGDPNDIVYIVVTDRTGRCPDDYQNADEFWNSATNKYTKEID